MSCLERLSLCLSRPVSELADRYAVLACVRRCCTRHGVVFLAFALHDDRLDLLVEGTFTDVRRAVLGVRRGLAHSFRCQGAPLKVSEGPRQAVPDLHDAVVTLHRQGDRDPLSCPWTSHRDLLALRQAPFFDAAPLAARVDPAAVHRDAGGAALPDGWPPDEAERVPLSLLLQVASAVLGVLPADRRSFPIFAHLARRAGYRVRAIAQALTLTPRRVRQYLGSDPEGLTAALVSLGDARLQELP